MKKRTIVIASVLKPVDDTRMFEKIGVSLARSGVYEVHIIGQPCRVLPVFPDITFHPLPPAKRLSFDRLMTPIRVLRRLISIKPVIVVVNTHELLIPGLINKMITGSRLVYDVRENYLRNIVYTTAFPPIIRIAVAAWVRLKEVLTSPFVNHFLLAEEGYANEIKFPGKRSTVIANKAVRNGKFVKRNRTRTKLLFTGTIAESTGIFGAINLAVSLNQIDPRITLDIVGYCAKASTLRRVMEGIEPHSFIHLLGGDRLVPHSEIDFAIADADFGIVCYPSSPHTANSIPTKIYEYMAQTLPMLLQNKESWLRLADRCSAAVTVDFDSYDAAALHAKMQRTFYTSDPVDVTWDSEEMTLLTLLSKI